MSADYKFQGGEDFYDDIDEAAVEKAWQANEGADIRQRIAARKAKSAQAQSQKAEEATEEK